MLGIIWEAWYTHISTNSADFIVIKWPWLVREQFPAFTIVGTDLIEQRRFHRYISDIESCWNKHQNVPCHTLKKCENGDILL